MTEVKDPGPAPAPPEDTPGAPGATPSDFAKLRYSQDLQAWLEKWKQEVSNAVALNALHATRDDTRTALDASRQDADRAAEAALVKSLHDAYISVTQNSIDRSLTRTNIVSASIGAVITVYTGLLALVYAAKPDSGRPLSASAIIPALFLGLALFLITIYAAMFKNSSSERGPLLPSSTGDPIVEYRLSTFMEWCFAAVGARTWALHAGIISLGLGVASLPVPFVMLTAREDWWILGIGLFLVIATAGVSAFRNRNKASGNGGPMLPDLPNLPNLPAGEGRKWLGWAAEAADQDGGGDRA